MRLGCEVTAADINPVAWFILKCTLEYPQKLAGQTLPLPEFALADREFMEAFLKAKDFKGARLRTFLERLGHGKGEGTQLGELSEYDSLLFEADLAWLVRAWGRWVLARARRELASYYPTYAEFQPLPPTGNDYRRPLRLLEVDDNGIAQLEPLNAEFNEAYLKDPQKPALGRQAHGGLPLGAHSLLQAVPGHVAPAQDPLAVQEGQQARSPSDGT